MAKSKSGFSLVEGLVLGGVLILVIGLGAVGYKSFIQQRVASTTPVSTSATAEVITNKSDLEAAERQLEALKIEDESATEAEAQADF